MSDFINGVQYRLAGYRRLYHHILHGGQCDKRIDSERMSRAIQDIETLTAQLAEANQRLKVMDSGALLADKMITERDKQIEYLLIAITAVRADSSGLGQGNLDHLYRTHDAVRKALQADTQESEK